jgi:hypothetical protein
MRLGRNIQQRRVRAGPRPVAWYGGGSSLALHRAGVHVAILCLLCACGGGLPPDGGGWSAGDWTGTTAYIPYVEEVTIQEPIYANEDFHVTLRVSAQQYPQLLAGTTAHSGPLMAPYPWLGETESGWVIDPWAHAPTDPALPVTDTWEYTLSGLPAGDWVVAVWQLQDRAQGGRSGLYELTPSIGAMDNTGLDLMFYPITVITRPAE